MVKLMMSILLLLTCGAGCPRESPRSGPAQKKSPAKQPATPRAPKQAQRAAGAAGAPAAAPARDAAVAAGPAKALALPDHALQATDPASARRFFRRWFKGAYPQPTPRELKVEVLKPGPPGLTPIVVIATTQRTEKCKESVVPKHEADDCSYLDYAMLHVALFAKEQRRYKIVAHHYQEIEHAPDQVAIEAELVDRGDWNGDGNEELLLHVKSTAEVIPAHGDRSTSSYHLLEAEANRIVERFQLDGGTTPLGTTLDTETTVTSTCQVECDKRGCALEVDRSTHCPTDEQLREGCVETTRTELYAWSSKRKAWQIFKGLTPEAHVLIAATRPLAAAQRTPLSTEQLRGQVSGWLELKPGYPRAVVSDEITGLRPGYQLVLLGLCKTAQEARLLLGKAPPGIRRKLQPYTRGVVWKKEPLACPTLAAGPRR